MNLRQIEVFQAVMESGGVTRAAEHLNVSQPSVSKTIKHIQSQLGMRLFERVKGRLVPTPEAMALYKEVTKVYLGMRSIQNIAEEMRAGRSGTLRVAATAALGLDYIPRLLSEFINSKPDLHCSLIVRYIAQVEELIASQQVDLGIVLFPSGSPSVKSKDFAKGKMVCIAHSEHPATKLDKISAKELSEMSLISYDSFQPFGRLIENYFFSSGLEFNIRVHVELCSTACSMVRHTKGVAIVDEFTALSYPDLHIIPLSPEITFSITMLTPLHRPDSLIFREFKDYLLKSF